MIDLDLIAPTIHAWTTSTDPVQKKALAEDILDFLSAEYEGIRESNLPDFDLLEAVLARCPAGLKNDLIRLVGLSAQFDKAREIAEAEFVPHEATARIDCLITARIGYGGQAVIYEAESRLPRRRVAVKVPRENTARLSREAGVLSKLDHAAIVPLLGRGVDDHGRDVLVMRRLDQKTLADLIISTHSALRGTGRDAQRMPGPLYTEVFRTFLTVCRAVQYAHNMGIVHRDLHPWNVMIHNGEPVVIDWGLAWLGEESAQTIACELRYDVASTSETLPAHAKLSSSRLSELPRSPQTTAAIGMIAFRSPELSLGPWNRPADPRSDVYSLGKILYTIATERLPADLDATDKARPAVPRPLMAVILRATSSGIDDRYPTADALAEDLERFLAGDPVAADKEPFAEKAGRWIGRNRTLAVSAAAAVMVSSMVAAGASWLLSRAQLRELKLQTSAKSQAERAEFLDRNTRHLASALGNLLTATDVMGLERRGFRGSDSARDFRRSLDEISRMTAPVIEDSAAAGQVSTAARAELIDSLGNAYRSIGEMKIARPLIMKGLYLRNAEASPDSATIGRSYFHLALLEHFSGNYDQAEHAYANAVRFEKQAPVPLDLELARIQFHHAWLFAERQQFAESVKLFDEVVSSRIRLLGENAQDVRYAKLARLIALTQRGDLAELIRETARLALTGDPLARLLMSYFDATQARRKADGTRNPDDVLRAREKLNGVLSSLSDRVPPRHPVIALLLGDIASFEWNHKNYDRAWTQILEAVEIGIEVAPAHPQLVSVMDRLADEAPKLNHEPEAEALFLKLFDALSSTEPQEVRERARRALRASLAKMPKYRANPLLLDRLP
jgi:serine/threonine protein kinase